MYFAIETRSAWDNTIHFSPSLLLKLKFWYCNIDCLNGYSIGPTLATHTVVFSDASDVAFGGFHFLYTAALSAACGNPSVSAKVLRSAN